MKRNKPKPDAIISADWHLTEKQPICRTDDFWEAQWDYVTQIKNLCKKYKCPLIIAGDIFDHWRASPYLINTTLEHLPSQTYVIFGNHEEPQHNLNLLKKSALYTLTKSSKVTHLPNQGDYGRDFDDIEYTKFSGKRIIVVHKLVWHKERPYPGSEDPQAKTLFKEFPKADLIITGDNHKTFTIKKGKQILVNPGSLSQQTADQIDHKPCVFFWSAKTNAIYPHFLKVKPNIIDRGYIDIKRQNNEKIQAFTDKLKTNWELSVNFKQNIIKSIKKNKIDTKTKKIILGWMGD